MIMVKAPFRISFAGGGSDIDSFYKKSYGAVVSATINKFMYIMIHPYFYNKIRIKYSKTEDVVFVEQVKHPLVRECLKLMNVEKGIEIASIADIPAGTGLGSSSAFTVSLLHALSAYKQKIRTKEWLARMACMIEIDKVGEPIGKQDQYATSFGGLNYIRFNPDDSVLVEPIFLTPEVKRKLQNNLLIFYVGTERKASRILLKQRKSMEKREKYDIVREMVKLAELVKQSLEQGHLSRFGELLHQSWLLKKSLTDNITNQKLDEYYNTALKAGAKGGKILGAGSGGFFLFYCESKYQERIRNVLKLRELKFIFDNEGSKIVYAE
jgi:D-glycero-alpha-D-manno-heptose-7-phosphate kinase